MENRGYRRLFIVRKDLNLSPGKLAVQLSHCSEEYWLQLIRKHSYTDILNNDYHSDLVFDKGIFEEYICGAIAKTVCRAKNLNDLLKARNLAIDAGLVEGVDFGFINDACRTELVPENEDGTCTTAFWTRPLPDEVAHSISKKYQLLKDNSSDF